MNYVEFAKAIKEKYPEYEDMSDLELAKAIVEKYPDAYSDVTFDDAGASEDEPLKNSPLNPLERIKMGFGDSEGNFEFLKNKYGEENVQPYKNSFIVKTDKGWQETDPTGTISDMPMDVLEILAPTAVDTAAQLGGAALGALAGNVPGAIAGGAGGAALGDAINQGIGNALGTRQGYDAKEGLISAVLGGAIPAVAPAVGKIKNAIKLPIAKGYMKIAQKINSPEFIDKFASLQEFLTSVPEKYTKKALEAELNGKSILTDKEAVGAAYDNIVKNLQKVKSVIKPAKEYDYKFNEIGNRAVKGLDYLGTELGNNFENVLKELPDKNIDADFVINDIKDLIASYGQGGTTNTAEVTAGKQINDLLARLEAAKNNPITGGLRPIDLHREKEMLYDMANYELTGQRQNTIKSLANKLNSYLRKNSKQYADENDKWAKLKQVEYESGGINPTTIGNKLAELSSPNAIRSGLYQRLKAVDDLMPKKYKFLDDAMKNLEEKEFEQNLMSQIGKRRFEKTPKSLGKLTDAEDEALEAVQKRYNDLNKEKIDILDELENANINESMNKWFPGQGGGSGSEQGAGNLFRTAVIGAAPTVAAITRKPVAMLGALAVSPKFMAKKSVQGLGKINKKAQDIMADVLNEQVIKPPSALNRAYNAVMYGLANRKNKPTMLYGGVSNTVPVDEYNNYDVGQY